MTTAARSPAHSCARRISTRGRQHLATANLIVFVTTNRFKPADPQIAASKGVQLPVATADTGKLIKAAMMALRALYRAGYRYKKAGVILLDLMPAANVPAGLFDAPDNTKIGCDRCPQRAFRPWHGCLWHGRRAPDLGAAAA